MRLSVETKSNLDMNGTLVIKRNEDPAENIYHHFSRKTSTAGHRPPPSVATLTGPVRLASSESLQPSDPRR